MCQLSGNMNVLFVFDDDDHFFLFAVVFRSFKLASEFLSIYMRLCFFLLRRFFVLDFDEEKNCFDIFRSA